MSVSISISVVTSNRLMSGEWTVRFEEWVASMMLNWRNYLVRVLGRRVWNLWR